MNYNQIKDYCYLDNIRINQGDDACKQAFAKAYRKNGWRVAGLLNDNRLTLPCLFILKPNIDSFKLNLFLNHKKIKALRIIEEILNTQNNGVFLSENDRISYSALKWMFETGSLEDYMNSEFEEIMDITVSLLINVYKDNGILPELSSMIFKRNRQGRNIHNLVWAFFQAKDIHALNLIAEGILHEEEKDVLLSCQLLGIEILDDDITKINCQKQYQDYIKWLDENKNFIFFTGESFQFSSKPIIYRVDLGRKYLNKSMADTTTLNFNETEYLKSFKLLNKNDKIVLSQYSYKLYNNYFSQWEKWIQSPIDEQMKEALSNKGGY